MGEIVRLSAREPRRRPAGPPAEGGADLLLFTGVRYSREDPRLRPRPKGGSKARKKRA